MPRPYEQNGYIVYVLPENVLDGQTLTGLIEDGLLSAVDMFAEMSNQDKHGLKAETFDRFVNICYFCNRKEGNR